MLYLCCLGYANFKPRADRKCSLIQWEPPSPFWQTNNEIPFSRRNLSVKRKPSAAHCSPDCAWILLYHINETPKRSIALVNYTSLSNNYELLVLYRIQAFDAGEWYAWCPGVDIEIHRPSPLLIFRIEYWWPIQVTPLLLARMIETKVC